MYLAQIPRLARTVRHLRPSQVMWRLRLRLRRRRLNEFAVPDAPQVRMDLPDVPDLRYGSGHDGIGEAEALLERGEYEHYNHAELLSPGRIDWRLGPRAQHRLWTLGLHEHAWAWDLARCIERSCLRAEHAKILLCQLLSDWIERCGASAPGSRDLAWNPYAIATRLGWWARLYHVIGPEARREWGMLDLAFLRSFWRQAAYLHEHVEWDLRGNHLLRDAVGLAWGGRFFAGEEPRRWLQTATKMAIEQVAEQLLPDGGHFERSPMYHVHVMGDLLSLALLLEDEEARARMADAWSRMAEFLAWIRHPDGQIPLFNDGGFNGACEPRRMFDAGRRCLDRHADSGPRLGLKVFASFGIAVWHGEPWSVFFDVGEVGPDYQPGHAHADTLTIEASYRGSRLFVDPGTFGYDHDAGRAYDRGTASHNSVMIDATDSSEVWHIFRVGRRARVGAVQVADGGGGVTVSAGHDGYTHLSRSPQHSRSVQVKGDGLLQIIDRIHGDGMHAIAGGLLLAPGWTAEPVDGGWEVASGRGTRLKVMLRAGAMETGVERRPYHPEYGREVECERLYWRGSVRLPCEIQVRVGEVVA